MEGQFNFSLLEKIELIQRVQELEAENQKLHREIDRLKVGLQIAREQEAGYYRARATAKVLSTDGSGVVMTM